MTSGRAILPSNVLKALEGKPPSTQNFHHDHETFPDVSTRSKNRFYVSQYRLIHTTIATEIWVQ